MPAFPRLAIPELPYHVTQRGNYRQDVFDTAEDREVYLGYVSSAAIAYGLGRNADEMRRTKCGRRQLNPRASITPTYSFYMPALPRLAIPEIPYHVTQRGNYRQDVFDTVEDREVYLGYVASAAIAYGLELHGWCLMTNHVHWIVLPPDQTAMAQTFRRAHSRFSAYVNRLRKRSAGHLWQGRYYSCPLDDQHLFRALLYVERNPVRAGLVRSAAEYQWSSVRARLGYTDLPAYLALSRWAAAYSAAEWAFLLDQGVGVEEENVIRASTQQGKPYGSARFVEELEGTSHRVLQVRRVGRPALEVRG